MKQIIQICPPSYLTDGNREFWEILDKRITVYVSDGQDKYIIITREMQDEIDKFLIKYKADPYNYSGRMYWQYWEDYVRILTFVDVWELKRKGGSKHA